MRMSMVHSMVKVISNGSFVINGLKVICELFIRPSHHSSTFFSTFFCVPCMSRNVDRTTVKCFISPVLSIITTLTLIWYVYIIILYLYTFDIIIWLGIIYHCSNEVIRFVGPLLTNTDGKTLIRRNAWWSLSTQHMFICVYIWHPYKYT